MEILFPFSKSNLRDTIVEKEKENLFVAKSKSFPKNEKQNISYETPKFIYADNDVHSL